MYEIKLQHKNCGAITFIYGESVGEALKKENIDKKFWEILSIELF